ncbi:MAG: ATP-dependent helicase, partial [Rhizobiaceae bacterium]|nr:ATP-dependent helicase [Rhizobiaceae bacterium]
IQDVSGHTRLDVFSYAGRVTIVHLLRMAEVLAADRGGIEWLEQMATETGSILAHAEWIDRSQASLFRASVEEMKSDMRHAKMDTANLSVEDLGMFASPDRALRLSTIHNAKGHEYAAVAIIGVREGTIPFYKAKTVSEIEAEKRQFYVGITRAERLLMYIGERDRFGNAPSRFLGPEGLNIIH